jgi:hypothetical protein
MLKKLFHMLFLQPQPARPDPAASTFDLWRSQIAPLGFSCAEIIFCLGGSEPHSPFYFNPIPTESLDQAALHYFTTVEEQHRLAAPVQTSDLLRALIAAGLFTCGHLTAFDTILEHAPPQPVQLDHGAGHCNRAAFMAIIRLLPLPEHLRNAKIWFQDSELMHELQVWYREHQQQLVWDEKQRRYYLVNS